MLLPHILLEISPHQLEVVDTLLQVVRFLVIFVVARAIPVLMMRLQLPTILSELVAGALISVSGLHLIVPPEPQLQISGALLSLLGSFADIQPTEVQAFYDETFPSLQAVSQIGLFALLFLTGYESELDELVPVGVQATTVAVAGVALLFVLGMAGFYYLFHSPLISAVFAGAAMTATSIAITSSMLNEILGIVAVAMAGKLAAGWSYLSSEPTNRLVVSLGIMPRGDVGSIFLGLGSQAGILTPALDAAIPLRPVIPPEPAAVTQ